MTPLAPPTTLPDCVVGDVRSWSYACPCLRCRWEAWWNEGDNDTIPMPEDPHPDGEYLTWFNHRESWLLVHPND